MMNTDKLELGLTKLTFFTGGALLSLFGEFNQSFKILCYFMVLDYFVGVLLSSFGYSKKTENGKIASNQIYKGIAKKVGILVIVSVSQQIGLVMNFDGLRNLVIFGFITFELTSLLEHAVLLGIPLPKVITDVLEVMNKKEQEGLNEKRAD